MKTVTILALLTLFLSFFQCASNKLISKPPFKIIEATSTKHTSRVPGVSGTVVTIILSIKENIAFDSLFYRNRLTKIEIVDSSDITTLRGNFKLSPKKQQDLILHSDAKRELYNKLPSKTKFPYQLKENEAILTYKINGKTKYYKVKNIKK